MSCTGKVALGEVTPAYHQNYQSSNSSFAYILGLGVDYHYRENLIANLGYQYTNLGSLSTGPGV